ncbi:MAG TPA: cbb3-type cytochrome c oxidase subunit I [Methylomirabilota bacterium]|nr:cbb3-type cytochrome c oxidase subunit I [Methylomirabilota bacterium]
MNHNEQKICAVSEIDASCRVPLLALFGGAALWLVLGLALSIVASLTFHKPDMLANCAWLTYGRVQPAANDLILYGFCIPAALGVMLWIFVRLSQTPICLSLLPIVAANIWHIGVVVGTLVILSGGSTGFLWLEYGRGASVLLLAAFVLIAISAFATFGWRHHRELHVSHWFLLAALLWFPCIYATANFFLVISPVRGVAQAVIDWWFANNLIFVWLALVGIGTAFYFLPKFAGRMLHNHYLALFAFWTLIIFGTWCGIPQGAPVPAWLPAVSTVASALLIIQLIAVAKISFKTVRGANTQCKGGSFCFVKFGTAAFILSGIIFIAQACPQISRIVEFTWFGPAQTQLQLLGFFAIVMLGAIYELLPRIMGFELPFPKFVRVQHWCFIAGLVLLVGSLAVAGIEQGLKLSNPAVAFADVSNATLVAFRFSTTGLLLLLLGSLLFAANIFVMTAKWKFGLLKTCIAAVKAPLATAEVKS